MKNQMMKECLENINDVESTICQIFKDVLGIGSEYIKGQTIIEWAGKTFTPNKL